MRRTKFVVVALILFAGSVVSDAAAPELVQVGNLKVETKIDGMGRPPSFSKAALPAGCFSGNQFRAKFATLSL